MPRLSEDSEARKVFAYEVLQQRSLAEHSQMWQMPSLTLAAQGFLLTIALDPDSSTWSAVFAAALAILVSTMAMQLMAARRFHFNLDRRKMTEIENDLGLINLAERGWAFDSEGSYQLSIPRTSVWRRAPTYVIWQLGLLAFVLADGAAIIIAVIR